MPNSAHLILLNLESWFYFEISYIICTEGTVSINVFFYVECIKNCTEKGNGSLYKSKNVVGYNVYEMMWLLSPKK